MMNIGNLNLEEKHLDLQPPQEEEKMYQEWRQFIQVNRFFADNIDPIRNVYIFIEQLKLRDISIFYAQRLKDCAEYSTIIDQDTQYLDQTLNTFYQQHSDRVHQRFFQLLTKYDRLPSRIMLGRMLRFLKRYHKVGVDQLSTKIPLSFPDLQKQINLVVDHPLPIQHVIDQYVDNNVSIHFRRYAWSKHEAEQMLKLIRVLLDSTPGSDLAKGLRYAQGWKDNIKLEKDYDVARGLEVDELNYIASEIRALNRVIEDLKRRLKSHGPLVQQVMDQLATQQDPKQTVYDPQLANIVQHTLGLPTNVAYAGLGLSQEQLQQRRIQQRYDHERPRSRKHKYIERKHSV